MIYNYINNLLSKVEEYMQDRRIATKDIDILTKYYDEVVETNFSNICDQKRANERNIDIKNLPQGESATPTTKLYTNLFLDTNEKYTKYREFLNIMNNKILNELPVTEKELKGLLNFVNDPDTKPVTMSQHVVELVKKILEKYPHIEKSPESELKTPAPRKNQ